MARVFLILGGYGNTGRLIARLLLQETDSALVLAGRNLDQGAALAEAFNQEFGAPRVSALRVDAADRQSLDAACAQVDCVVAASSTSQHTENVARAAIAAGIDYLDVQYSAAKVEMLRTLQGDIERAGLCFITDGGFHPGLPAALVRFAASRLDRLETANVGSVIKIDWRELRFSPATIEELVREFQGFEPLRYRAGRWAVTRWNDYQRFDFGPPFGQQPCMAMMLPEMRPLPEMIPSLREAGFFVGGFNWFVDYLLMPLAWPAMRLWPRQSARPVGRLMEWGLRAFSKPPYRTILQLEADGWQGGQRAHLRVKVAHPDGYVLTAAPVAACLLQYLDGSARRPGLWFQANIVDPVRLLQDMERMGVTVEIDLQPEYVAMKGNTMPKRRNWRELTPAQKVFFTGAGIVQMALLILALVDLRRRPAEQINGSKRFWTLAAFVNFIGPISYFLLGRKRGS